nr:MAG TPA: hypothetical protein [Caudoviricetes sp.]
MAKCNERTDVYSRITGGLPPGEQLKQGKTERAQRAQAV